MSKKEVLRTVTDKKPVSDRILRLVPSVGIALILGSEGSGKSNLGYGILESLKDTGRKLLVYGLPLEKSIYLPDYITICTSMEFPEDSIVLADEAYLSFHSRGSMSSANKFMDTFSGLVRQKDILGIFISQFSRKLDIGLVSAPRVLLIKQPSLLQMRLDRSELRSLIADATAAFKKLGVSTDTEDIVKNVIAENNILGTDTVVNPRCLVATYVISDRFEGMIDKSNQSPSFWSKELSKAWKGVSLAEEPKPTESIRQPRQRPNISYLTTEQRLQKYKVPPELYDRVIEMDGRYTYQELHKLCRSMGLPTSGDKKRLASNIILSGEDNGESGVDS